MRDGLYPLILAIAATLQPAIAQQRGTLAATEVAVVPGNGALAGEILCRSGGSSAKLSLFSPPTNGAPHYSREAMFGPLAPLVELDAISSGNDWVPMNEGGVVDPMNTLWAMASYVFDDSELGEPGSAVESERLANGGVGLSTFGFYFEDSAMSDTYPGQEYLEHSGADVVNAPEGTTQIVAYDPYLPDIVSSGGQPVGIITVVDQFYFSVTSESAALLPVTFFDGGPPSGATVLRVTWVGGQWSAPQLVSAPADLGLLPTENIDGLGVTDGGETVMFSLESTAGEPPKPQMSVRLSGSTETLEIGRTTGATLFAGTGARAGGDAKAICFMDPEYMQLDPNFSAPLLSAGMPEFMHLSLGKFRTEHDEPAVRLLTSGWGLAGPVAGTLRYMVSFDGGVTFFSLQPQERSPSDHLLELELLVPTQFLGRDVIVYGYFTAAGQVDIAFTHRVGVIL